MSANSYSGSVHPTCVGAANSTRRGAPVASSGSASASGATPAGPAEGQGAGHDGDRARAERQHEPVVAQPGAAARQDRVLVRIHALEPVVHEREPAIVGDRLQLVGGAAGETERLADREVAEAEHGLERHQGELDIGGLSPQRQRRLQRADAPTGDEDAQTGATVGGRDRARPTPHTRAERAVPRV